MASHLCVDVGAVFAEQAEAALSLLVGACPAIAKLGPSVMSQDSRPADNQRVQGGLAALVPASGTGRKTNFCHCAGSCYHETRLTKSDETAHSSSCVFVCFARSLSNAAVDGRTVC